MITKFDAILSILPGAAMQGSWDEMGVEVIEWRDDRPKPTESAINAKLAELQAEYDAQAYARKREAEYPTIQELVVALYDTDDKSAIEAKRAAVKAKYPKG